MLLQSNWALALYRARRYEESLQKWTEVRQLYPQNPMPPYLMSLVEVQLGQMESAVLHVLEAKDLAGQNTTYQVLIPYVFACAGKMQEAKDWLRSLSNLSKKEHIWLTAMAINYARIGETDEALDILEEAYIQRSGWIVFLAADPAFDPLRNQPRFESLLNKLGLKN